MLAPPRVIGIFDEVLTTGAHFKAVQELLQVQFAQAKIIGLFIARRVPETVDPDEFDVMCEFGGSCPSLTDSRSSGRAECTPRIRAMEETRRNQHQDGFRSPRQRQ